MAGFGEEFEKIYMRYFNDVFLFLKKLSKDESIAEEITSETFFKAMMPVFVTLSIASGSYETVTPSAVMAGAGILTNMICNAILPAIIMAASLEMINNLSERPMLSRFTKLFQVV